MIVMAAGVNNAHKKSRYNKMQN